LRRSSPFVIGGLPLRRWVGQFGRMRLGFLVALGLLTGAAWCLTVYHAVKMSMPMGIAVRGGMAAEGMAGMAMAGMSATHGWSFAGAVVFVAVWTVMMAAMMLPAATPMVIIFASAQARRQEHVAVPTWIFIAGYMIVWAAAGIFVYVLVQFGSELATMLASRQMGTVRARKYPGCGRTLSVYTDQERLPQSLPLASCLRRPALARWTGRCTRHGAEARCVLFRLLLGAVRGDGRCRSYELGVDASAYADRFRREGVAAWSARRSRVRRRSDTSWNRGRCWGCPDAVARLAKIIQRPPILSCSAAMALTL
jgi:hypothetical protein